MSSTRETPTSVGQRLIWMMERYRGADGALNSNVLFHIRGNLDVERLHRAVELVASRHEALRTSFRVEKGRRLLQVIHPTAEVFHHVANLQGVEAKLDSELRTQLTLPLSLEDRPLRTAVYQVAPSEHVVALIMHHLVTDAWSAGLICGEIGQAYVGLGEGVVDLPPVTWQYSDFVSWQSERLAQGKLKRMAAYWRTALAGVHLPDVGLETATGPPAAQTLWEVIDADTVARLRRRAPEENTTPFVLLLATFYRLLNQISGASDLAVASMMANRVSRPARGAVGFFANMVMLRTRLQAHDDAPSLVQATTRTVMSGVLNQEFPLQLLPLDTWKSMDGRPDEVVFQVLSEEGELKLDLPGLDVSSLPQPHGLGYRFPLEFLLGPAPGGSMWMMIRFAAHRISPATVVDMAARYKGLLSSV